MTAANNHTLEIPVFQVLPPDRTEMEQKYQEWVFVGKAVAAYDQKRAIFNLMTRGKTDVKPPIKSWERQSFQDFIKEDGITCPTREEMGARQRNAKNSYEAAVEAYNNAMDVYHQSTQLVVNAAELLTTGQNYHNQNFPQRDAGSKSGASPAP